MKQRPSSRLKSWLFRSAQRSARVGETIVLQGYALLPGPSLVVLVTVEPDVLGQVVSAMAQNNDPLMREAFDSDRAAVLPHLTKAEVRRFAPIPGGMLSCAEVLILDGVLAGAVRWTLLRETPTVTPTPMGATKAAP